MRSSLLTLAFALPISGLACARVDPQGGATGGAGRIGIGPSPMAGGSSAGGSSAGGSSAGGLPAGGGTVGASDAGQTDVRNCGLQTFELVRKPADLLLVLDRSGSMKSKPSGSTTSTSKWDLVVPAISEVVTATNASLSWGMKTFPEGETSGCAAGAITSHIDVAIAPDNATAVNAAIAQTTPNGDGTPTGDAINAAVTFLKTLPNDHARYILVATDGQPTCPSPSTNARAYAVQAVADAATAGIHTFVVGVATKKAAETAVLNDMAVAGLEARTDPSPMPILYYLASTQDELATALKVITGLIPNCLFTLTSPPPVPESVAVKVGGVRINQDPAHQNGWDYTGANHDAVAVFGASCDAIQNSAANTVQIIYGCKDIIIP